ncbi:MAG: hypothetical protein GXO89_01570 [Chlorobi bacterium]|nr:hypothetical protein [Chlorobiota bacterium]
MKTKINILSTKVIMALTVMIVFAISANAQINYGTNTVTGTNASAIGDNNTASGNSSFVGGIDSEALGQYSLAYGDSAKAWSRNGIALGKQVSVFGEAFFQEGVVLGGTVSLNGNWIKTGNYGSGGIFIDNNNHVGIGTDTPSASLDIAT